MTLYQVVRELQIVLAVILGACPLCSQPLTLDRLAARQYSGTIGGIELCQVAVTLTYASGREHALIGRALYMPGGCAADEEHRELAGVPEQVLFATKPQLALALLDRAQSLRIRAAFVAGDQVYGGPVLALDPGVRAALGGALRHPGSCPGPGQRVDRGLYPEPAALRAGHDVPGRLRAGTKGREGGLRCPRFSVIQDPPVLGPVQFILPWTGPALRRNIAAIGKHG